MKGYITISVKPITDEHGREGHKFSRKVQLEHVGALDKACLFHQLFDALGIEEDNEAVKHMIIMGIRDNIWPDSSEETLKAASEKMADNLVNHLLDGSKDDVLRTLLEVLL